MAFGLIFPRNFFIYFTVVAVVLIYIESMLNFLLELGGGGTDTRGTANFSLEGGSVDDGVVA